MRAVKPAPRDEVVLVQLFDSEVTDLAELQKFATRFDGVRRRLLTGVNSAVVRGLFVAVEFSDLENVAEIEKVHGPQLRFTTWQRALTDSLDMHESWMNLAAIRAREVEG